MGLATGLIEPFEGLNRAYSKSSTPTELRRLKQLPDKKKISEFSGFVSGSFGGFSSENMFFLGGWNRKVWDGFELIFSIFSNPTTGSPETSKMYVFFDNCLSMSGFGVS